MVEGPSVRVRTEEECGVVVMVGLPPYSSTVLLVQCQDDPIKLSKA